jgi:predicted enzyme related to lactoylglutathione lyase
MEKIGMNLIQFIVPDVDAVRAEVVARGGKIHTEPFPLGQIATIMFVEGPDGILFEFAGPLAQRFRK